ncbi:MAG: hypothetical protein ACKN9V_07025 [Pseudomonadota bacterium]
MTKFLIGLFLASAAFGADIFTVGISTSFRYEDMEKQCYLPPLSNNFVLAAETEGNKIIKAKLKKTRLDGFSQILDLSSEDIAGIETQWIDSRQWLKTWRVSGKVLAMLLYGGTDQGFDTCYPYQGIDGLEPDSFVFTFTVKGIKATYSDSNEAHFSGATKDNQPYRIEMYLIQERY